MNASSRKEFALRRIRRAAQLENGKIQTIKVGKVWSYFVKKVGEQREMEL